MRNRLAIVLAAALLAIPAGAQQIQAQKITAQQFVVQPAGGPTPVGSLAATPSQPGAVTDYAWIVSTDATGSVLSGPWKFAGMPTPSPSVPIIFDWDPSPDTTSYALLITGSFTPPTGACGCEINAGFGGITYFEWTGGYEAYTVPALLADVTLSNSGNSIATPSFEGVAYADQFGGTTAAQRVAAAESFLGGNGVVVLPSDMQQGNCGYTAQPPSSLLDFRGLGSLPTGNLSFYCSPLEVFVDDDSPASTNPNAQADSSITPLLHVEGTETGAATLGSVYWFSKSEAGASGGLYGLIGSVDSQTGARNNVVADNLVAGLDQEYSISSISRSSNVATATITSSLGAPNTFKAGDCILVNGVSDASFDSGSGCFTVTAVSVASMTVSWDQTGANGTSSGGTIALGTQYFGLELDSFVDAYDPQPLTATIAENISPAWGVVSTGQGTYPGTAAFFANGKWHNGFVCQTANEACFVAGYPDASGSPSTLAAAVGFESRPAGYATTAQNFGSLPTVWQDSFYSGGEAEHNFSASMVVGAGTAPAESWQICYQTDSVCGLQVTSAGQIIGVNGSVGSPAFGFAGNPNTGFWNSGGAIHLTEGGTDRFVFLAPNAGATTLATGPNDVTVTSPSASGTLALSGANGSSRGTISISAATSGSHTFAAPYSVAPICTATENATPTALTYSVSATTSTVTVFLSVSGSGTFNWSCGPAVN